MPPGAIPADQLSGAKVEVLSNLPAGAIPAGQLAASAVQPGWGSYLDKLSPDEIVRSAQGAQAKGETDLSEFRDAYAKRKAEPSWFHRNTDGTAKPSPGPLQIAQGVDEGLFRLLDNTTLGFTGHGLVSGLNANSVEDRAKAINEIGASVQTGTGNSLYDVYRGVRALSDWIYSPNGPASGRSSVGAETVQEAAKARYAQDFHDDLDFANWADKTAAASLLSKPPPGSLLSSPESQKAMAIDPENVRQMAPITSLANVIPLGGGVQTAAEADRVAEMAATVMKRLEPPSKGAQLAAATADKISTGLRSAQRAVENNPIATGAVTGGIAMAAGGDFTKVAASAGFGSTVVSAALGKAANFSEKASGILLDRVPPGPTLKFVSGLSSAILPELKGAAAGQLLNTPFLLGASSPEDLQNMLYGGLAFHIHGRALGMASNGMDVAKNYYRNQDVAPEVRPEVRNFKLDPVLDEANAKSLSEVNNAGVNRAEAIRQFLFKQGKELYILKLDDYHAAVDNLVKLGMLDPGAAVGAHAAQGVAARPIKLPDGTIRQVALSLFSDYLPGMSVGHEGGHLLEWVLSPNGVEPGQISEELQHIYNQIETYYGPEELAKYKTRHEAIHNSQLPEGSPQLNLSKNGLLSEIFAENASGAMNSMPVAKFGIKDAPSNNLFAREIYGAIGRVAEKIGMRQPELSPDPNVAGRPRTGLGLDPSMRLSHTIENIIQAKVKDGIVPKPTPEVSVGKGVSMNSETGSTVKPAGETVGPISDVNPLARPAQPPVKKGDPVGDIRQVPGDIKSPIVGENAVIEKVNADGTVVVSFDHTDPKTDVMTRKTGTIKVEDLPVSNVRPGGEPASVGYPGVVGPETPLGPKDVAPHDPVLDISPGEVANGEPMNNLLNQQRAATNKFVRSLPDGRHVFTDADGVDTLFDKRTNKNTGKVTWTRMTDAQDITGTWWGDDGEMAANMTWDRARDRARDAEGNTKYVPGLRRKGPGEADTSKPAPKKTPPVTPPVAGQVTGQVAPNVRTTPEAQGEFVAKATDAVHKANRVTLGTILQQPRADQPAVETNYYSAKSPVSSPDAAIRELQRKAADAAEADAKATGKRNPLRSIYQKVFVPYKWATNYTLKAEDNARLYGDTAPRQPGGIWGMSLDKVIQNTDLLRGALKLDPKLQKIAEAHGIDPGYLSSPELRTDIQNYLNNQAHGYGGDGTRLIRPGDTREGTVTPEDKNFKPVALPLARRELINLLMGLEQQGSRSAGMEYAHRFAELNGIVPRQVGMDKKLRPLTDNNLLRADLRRAGFDPGILNSVVENLPTENFTTPLKIRPDLHFPAGDTGIMQAGFMPAVVPATERRAQGNNETRDVVARYIKDQGIQNEPHTGNAPIDEAQLKKIADEYEAAKHEPENPAVQQAYAALAAETLQQYRAMEQAGIRIEPFTGNGEPYLNSHEMLSDVRENKHLFFLPTEGNFSGAPDNPMLAPSGVKIDGRELPVNDVFRAVHDYFGHTAEGYEFGSRGEFNAYLAHSRMFSDAAKPALAAETLAQNAWVNFGPHLRRPDDSLPRPGEQGFVAPKDRPFAPQKSTTISTESVAAADATGRSATFMPATPRDIVKNGDGTKTAFFDGQSYLHYDDRDGKFSALAVHADPADAVSKLEMAQWLSRSAKRPINLDQVVPQGATSFMPAVKDLSPEDALKTGRSVSGWILPDGKFSFGQYPFIHEELANKQGYGYGTGIEKLRNAGGVRVTLGPAASGEKAGEIILGVDRLNELPDIQRRAVEKLSQTHDLDVVLDTGRRISFMPTTGKEPAPGESAGERPFYSQLEKTLAAIPPKANREQIDAALRDGVREKGVLKERAPKQEEMADVRDSLGRSFSEFIHEEPTATREDMLDFAREGRVQVSEKTLGAALPPSKESKEQKVIVAKAKLELNRRLATVTELEQDLVIRAQRDLGFSRFDPENILVRLNNHLFVPADYPESLRQLAKDYRKARGDYTLANVALADAESSLRKLTDTGTKYEKYQLPGGENYREHVFTLSGGEQSAADAKVRTDWLSKKHYAERDMNSALAQLKNAYDVRSPFDLPFPNEQAALARGGRGENDAHKRGLWGNYNDAKQVFEKTWANEPPEPKYKPYRSTHFPEIPGYLAHARTNERTLAAAGGNKGETALHAEEIQSDLHQEGRKGGYVASQLEGANPPLTPEQEARYQELANKRSKTTEEIQELGALQRQMAAGPQSRPNSGKAPDAPFKKSWHELVFKKLLRQAAELGKDRLTWTTGRQQADRYDLSKQVSTLQYDPENQVLEAWSNGENVVPETKVPPEKLGDYVGEGLAKKLLVSPINKSNGMHRLEGLDLQMGGEGMHGFYDQILPRFADKYLKRFGVKTEDVSLSVEKPSSFPGKRPLETETVHSVRISPEMRAEFLTKGQPSYMPNVDRVIATPEFKKWFGKSVVVDKNGKPQVMFHGTDESFNKFAPYRGMIFFTPSPRVAGDFSTSNYGRKLLPDSGPNILPVFIKSENPFDYHNQAHLEKLFQSKEFSKIPAKIRKRIKEFVPEGGWLELEYVAPIAKELGFDGLWVEENLHKNLAVFDPKQVKSATGNTGEFNPRKADIRLMPKAPAPTGWVLPNGDYEGMDPNPRGQYLNEGDWHNENLYQNRDRYAKFGLKFANDGLDRQNALQKGFVRVRYNGATGTMGIEAHADKFKGKVLAKTEDVVEANLGKIDSLNVSLLNNAGKVVRQSGGSLFRLSGQDKSQGALDALHGRDISPPSMQTAMMPATPAVAAQIKKALAAESSQYEALPKGEADPLAEGDKFYLTPDLRWIKVEEHEEAAQEILGRHALDNSVEMNANQAYLQKLGWARVVNEGEQDRQMNVDSNAPLWVTDSVSVAQMRELKNVAIENGLTLKHEYFDEASGKHVEKTIYQPDKSETEASFMPKVSIPQYKEKYEGIQALPGAFWLGPNGEVIEVPRGTTHAKISSALLPEGEKRTGVLGLGKMGWIRGVVGRETQGTEILLSQGSVGKPVKMTREQRTVLEDYSLARKWPVVDDNANSLDPFHRKVIFDPKEAGPDFNAESGASLMPATLQDFKKSNLKGLPKKSGWAILSAENPDAKPLPEKDNETRTDALLEDLDRAGYKYTPAVGKYGNVENSFVVTGIKPDEALALGKKYGQQAVLLPQGNTYMDRSYNPATGDVQIHAKAPKDYYTTMPDGTLFTYGVDFNKTVPAPDRRSLAGAKAIPAPRALANLTAVAPSPKARALDGVKISAQ